MSDTWDNSASLGRRSSWWGDLLHRFWLVPRLVRRGSVLAITGSLHHGLRDRIERTNDRGHEHAHAEIGHDDRLRRAGVIVLEHLDVAAVDGLERRALEQGEARIHGSARHVPHVGIHLANDRLWLSAGLQGEWRRQGNEQRPDIGSGLTAK